MSGETGVSTPAKWWLGPPAPRTVTHLTRLLQLSVLILMSVWVFNYLGGLRLTPRPVAGGGNDTSQLFNWHPLLLTIAFPVLMAEAVLAYKAPLVEARDRQQSKMYHFALHSAALVCTVLGVVAAFKSHTLKRPAPIPNLYSAHSLLGLSVLALLVLQYLLAAFSYLYPKLSLAQRKALGPLHTYLGKAVFAAGIAAMALGIQEKQTFIQAFAKPPSVYAGVMRLPALLVPLLLLTALAVLYHHARPAEHVAPGGQWRQLGIDGDGSEETALVPAERSGAAAGPAYSDSSHIA